MASIEATDDLRVAQKAAAPVLFPTPPAALQVPLVCDSRSRVDSQAHFGIRPALAALQNTFTSRPRASSDAASRSSVIRSPHFTRFMGLEPRPRTGSSATAMVSNYLTIHVPALLTSAQPQNAKVYPSALSFPIVESPDDHASRAPRIPSFVSTTAFNPTPPPTNLHRYFTPFFATFSFLIGPICPPSVPLLTLPYFQYDMDSDSFGQDLGLSLGLNPRFSAASTVRAHSLSLAPEKGRALKDLFTRNHLDQPQDRAEHPLEVRANCDFSSYRIIHSDSLYACSSLF